MPRASLERLPRWPENKGASEAVLPSGGVDNVGEQARLLSLHDHTAHASKEFTESCALTIHFCK